MEIESMYSFRRHFTAAALAIAALAPAGRADAQDLILVRAFTGTTGQDQFPPGTQPYIRRGRTSSVEIVKDLIDLVPFGMISVSGGGAFISGFQNGRTAQGTGFLRLSMGVPETTAVGTIITLSVGLTDRFEFNVVRTAIVTSLTRNPDPSTIVPTTPWLATFQGTDIGAPELDLSRLQCHAAREEARTNNSFAVTLTSAEPCSAAGFILVLRAIPGQTPTQYRFNNGAPATFSFVYAPEGPVCTSIANLQAAPVVTNPANGQLIVFGPSTVSPTQITLRWEALLQPGQIQPPLNEFIVTRQVPRATSPLVNEQGLAGPVIVSETVGGTSKTYSFAIPGTYTFSVRAKNCGDSAPSTTVTFTTRYQ
jgi:hypothetical protein